MKITDRYVFFWGGIYSQWYACTFIVDKITFNCTEQYMMYKKAMLFGDNTITSLIMESSDPKEQKALGKKVKNFNKDIWESQCKEIVFVGNQAKFSQNPILFQEMLATGKRKFVEASPYDVIWGIGMSENDKGVEDPKNWKGTNWLGEALDRVKEYLFSISVKH